MLGRVVPLDPVQQPPRLRGREGFVQAGPVVRVQIVLHQADLLRLGVMHVHQLPHAQGIVLARPPRAHPDMPPAAQGLTHQQLVADPLAFVRIVHLNTATPPARPSHLAKQLLARLVEADHGVVPIVRQQVGLDHILHTPDILGVGVRRDAPGFNDPRLDVVFFSALRTVSMPTRSTRPRTTSSSASSCRVQWQRPWGGSLQASSTRRCSTFPLTLTLSGRSGCRRRSRAQSSPSVTSCWRTRETVRKLVPKAATICSSACSSPWESSASRRMRAWVSLRAAAFPLDTMCSRSARSSCVKVTPYLSIAVVLFSGCRRPTARNQATAFTCQMKMDGPLHRLHALLDQSADALEGRMPRAADTLESDALTRRQDRAGLLQPPYRYLLIDPITAADGIDDEVDAEILRQQ